MADHSRIALGVALSFTLAGCGGSGSEDTSSTDDSAEADAGDAGESETDGTADTGVPSGPYAKDITLVDIRANQGAAIPLWLDGDLVAAGDRNARLIRDRRTMFRGVWSIPEGWEPRTIRGELHIVAPDGSEQVGEHEILVEGEPDLRQPDGAFTWIIPRELAVAGSTFYVELFEVDAPHVDDPATENVPRYPAADSADIGFEDVTSELDIVLVPLQHTIDGCDQSPEVTDELIEDMRTHLMARYPVQQVNISTHETGGVVTGSMASGYSPALVQVSAVKEDDGADILTHYYGIIDPCDAPMGTTCSATGGLRVAVGRHSATSGNDFVESTEFCVGRSMLLGGVACPNTDQGNIDENYPYENGLIGTWGFDINDLSVKRPTTHYSMQSFCAPRWYSDYEWKRLTDDLAE